MKKNLLLFSLAAFPILITSSCMREDMPKKDETKMAAQTITVELKKNETYHYTLPQNTSDDPYQVTRQASHYSVSELTNDQIYSYTPTYNYVGTDQVIIANVEEQHHDGNSDHHIHNNNNGGCSHHDESEIEQTITINFIIKGKEGKDVTTTITPSF